MEWVRSATVHWAVSPAARTLRGSSSQTRKRENDEGPCCGTCRLATLFDRYLCGNGISWTSRIGLSVTGQSVWVCTCAYGGQRFERVIPSTDSCPMSVEVY